VIKTRRFGYDGKGQSIIGATATIRTGSGGSRHQIRHPQVFVPFEREISVIGRRAAPTAMSNASTSPKTSTATTS